MNPLLIMLIVITAYALLIYTLGIQGMKVLAQSETSKKAARGQTLNPNDPAHIGLVGQHILWHKIRNAAIAATGRVRAKHNQLDR